MWPDWDCMGPPEGPRSHPAGHEGGAGWTQHGRGTQRGRETQGKAGLGPRREHAVILCPAPAHESGLPKGKRPVHSAFRASKGSPVVPRTKDRSSDHTAVTANEVRATPEGPQNSHPRPQVVA